MPTRPYFESIRELCAEKPGFGEALLVEINDALNTGEDGVAKIMLRDYIRATMGFEELGRRLNKSPDSLMHMLSEDDDPTLKNFSALLCVLHENEAATHAS